MNTVMMRRKNLCPLLLSLPLLFIPSSLTRPLSAQTAAPAVAPAETTLKIQAKGQTLPLHTADLDALPHKTITVVNGHTKATESYSGVLLSDLLARAGAPLGDQFHGKAVSNYVIATGSDGYHALLSLAEADPSFHSGDIIVADKLEGHPLAKSGPLQLIVSEDKRPARWVRNLVSIELIELVESAPVDHKQP